MLLNQEEIAHYVERGYVVGPRVLSDGQISMLQDRVDDILDGRVDFPVHLMGETVERSREKGQLPAIKVVNLFRHDAIFANMVHNPLVSALAHQIVDGPVRMWEDQMIYKPAFDEGAVLAWHQDYTFWDHVGPSELTTCWIALEDANSANGCMHVIPESHRWPLNYSREHVDTADPNWLLQIPGIPSSADLTPVACPVLAGHCHFHHCRTFHGSYGNRTATARRSYIMHLMPGTTRRLGDNWNERQGNVEVVPVGEILQGSGYPELVSPAGGRNRFQ